MDRNAPRGFGFLKKVSQWMQVARVVLVSGLLGGNLATLALLRRPRDAWYHVQYGLFGWRMIKGQGLPVRQFHDLFVTPDFVALTLLPRYEHYMSSWDANYAKDVVYLAMMAQILSPRNVFEIGTLRGHTALLFALNTQADSVIWTLDLPAAGSIQPSLSTTIIDDSHVRQTMESIGYFYSSNPQGHKITQLHGDSAQFDFTPYRNQIDLFFIDGAHSYEYVRSDTLRALDCVRHGGVIVWHDYGRWGVNGVSKWLHEFAKTGRKVCRLPGSSLAVLKV